ncbi:Conserved_hypothetical protein [Hexamita inflata]|uniref:Transmembrane protein n=1 Tax=Hexamita inflata TaxID=28002 RepID=A0AA86NQI9_9EUKA|nr:Conserved hypothetical protein [Hexamita inflata]
MIFLHLFLQELTIGDKTELSDCYNASSYVRLVTIRSKRYYRLYLTPTGKSECYQIPRGVNVTVFSNALVDVNGNFISTSFITVNFSYQTTIGINIQCLKCVDDKYLSSNQVIVTIESIIHFTRLIMGSVLTEKGLQVNCFQSSRTTIDLDYIQLQVSNSNNCPQLISSTNSNNMKNLISADVYIIYLNGDIDRFEKLTIGTDFQTLRKPPSWGSTNTFNVTVPNIGLKPLSSSIQFIQFQLYFESTGATLMTSIQVNNYTVIQFQKAYSSVKFKVQGASAYLDLVANTTIVSSGLPVFQDYNNQIKAISPDLVQIKFFGYSSSIPTAHLLDGTQITSLIENNYQEPSMSFTLVTKSFLFSTGRTRMQCKYVLENDCEVNLKRYLITNDSTYQFNMIIRFFKNASLVKVMNQNIGSASESCFSGAVIKVEQQQMEITLGKASNNCQMSGQKVNLVLNMSQTNINTTYQQINVTGSDFAYTYIIQLSSEQFINLQNNIRSNSKPSQMLTFYVGDVLMDYVSIDELYISREAQYKEEAKNVIIAVSVAAVMICTCMLIAPQTLQRIKITKQKQQLKRIIIVNHDDL